MNNLAEEKEVEEVLQEEPRVEPVEVEIESVEESAENFEDSEQRQVVSDSKKRIDRLTKKMREAERREQDAIAYAQAVKKEADELKGRMKTLDKDYVTEYSGRVESELQTAKNTLRQAMSIGDSDAAVDAQEKIAELMVAKERARNAQARFESESQEVEVPQPEQNVSTQRPVQRPDPKAEEWASKNEWFGSDEAMTYAAFGIHKKLVESEGFDPQSDEYYNELDKQLADTFPQKLGNIGKQTSKPVQTVASASRTANSSGRRNKVRLTQSQVAMAKKLGVPLEEYAKYVKE